MKCRRPETKCECKNCSNHINGSYCKHFKTDNMCDKCDWKGEVTMCSNRIEAPVKLYYDLEFTGLHRNTTVISIGLISGCGRTFYAELTDYDGTQVDCWIKKNVIDNLFINNDVISHSSVQVKGDRHKASKMLREWLDSFDRKIEWVSDVCHYDFVLLIDLVYGHALKMPYGEHCAACHDINQDIAKYYNITEIEAFDKSREDIVSDIPGNKHNALYDAQVIKAIYEKINRG